MLVKIEGPTTLSGEIEVYGSKNAALPLLAAALLTKEDVILHNMPGISDLDCCILRGCNQARRGYYYYSCGIN
jgi:UDP-N-acetylglucosamine enolpyruvyl transferase